MHHRKPKRDAAIGPGEVEMLECSSEGDDPFNRSRAVAWVVAKAADRTFRKGLCLDQFETDGMAILDPLPNLVAGAAGARNIKPRGRACVIRPPAQTPLRDLGLIVLPPFPETRSKVAAFIPVSNPG